MNNLNYCFVFVFLSFDSVQSTNVCEFKDSDCITRVAGNIISLISSGVENIIEPIDPLAIKNVTINKPGFEYSITNAMFTGLKNCVPRENLDPDESTYDYVLRCPQLVLIANVVAKGNLGPIYVDGSDSITITADDYVITIKGHYGTFISDEDQLEHFYLKDVIHADTSPVGKITIKTNNMFGLPKTQVVLADTYFKNNWKMLEKIFRYPIISEFASVLLKAIDIYLRATPISKLNPEI